MQATASSSEVLANMGMYFIISVAFFMILDFYAKKKIGGKRMLGYKILRMPRFFSLVFVSAYTIVIFLLAQFEIISVSYSTLTYLGLPYFIAWIFFLVNVLRRVRAETKGRPWLKS